jgi:hypothetical protein
MAKALGLETISSVLNEPTRNTEAVDNIYQLDTKEQTEKQFITFKLVNPNREGGVVVPAVQKAYNPKTKREELMRLINGVNEIWVSEQKGLDPLYVKENLREIKFARKIRYIHVPSTDVSYVEFMRFSEHCVNGVNGKPNTKFSFYEYDAEKEAEEALGLELLELEMAGEVSKMSDTEVEDFSRFLKLTIYDAVAGGKKPIKSLRTQLMLHAKRTAKDFKKLIGDKKPEVQLYNKIQNFITENKIDISTTPGRAFWANGGGLIGVIPANTTAVKHLTELALTNSEAGRTFKKQIESTT